MAGETDAIRELTDDHRHVEDIFRQIEALPSADRICKIYTDRATIELVRHFVSEEEFVYPVLSDRIADGADLAKKGMEDHGRVEQLMRDLEDAEAGTSTFGRLVDQLLREVRLQTREEEDLLFPRLQAALPPTTLTDLGSRIRRVKSIVPTRPYPAVPGVPPTSKLLFPGPGLVDRVRAVLSGWSHAF
ncbi:hemerythrin domain-containing protein [Streptomyces sp. HC44]|uniref:Hemerythrin domain-containing protein n=1 Tax=Streptomyces scabichelini TaxID=2711217 RepID=A0A6G4V0G9_9ACTN|nr:hemerythrin domain-containing protein [Streptomyces scabichelini]NGO07400.1 hemerythrin domain-containing protein [Streptomyces scabichelini]